MNKFSDNSEKNINSTLAVVKLASLFFCVVVLISNSLTYYYNNNEHKSMGNYTSFSIIGIATMITIYCIWYFLTVSMPMSKYAKIVQAVEPFIFILIYSALIFSTNAYKSNLKFIFLLIIITTTIQMGKYYGTIIAFISSLIILLSDLILAPSMIVNTYFENDLILSGVFILTAWTLGHYVKIEREVILSQNLQLETMDKELKEHSMHREYMEKLLIKDDVCYNLLIENSSDAILVHRNSKILFGNESASKLVGVKDTNKLVDMEFLDLADEKYKAFIEQKLNKIYNEKIALAIFEHEIARNEGSCIFVQNTSTFFMYEGKPTILSILHDITSEKQVEKLQNDMKENINLLKETREFNRLITEFFSNISHELKTPLNVIFSAIQYLNICNVKDIMDYDKQQKKYLGIMKQNCYRLMRLINNLLDMTKLDSGFLKLSLGNYNIVSVVEDIVLSVASYAESMGISIIFDTDIEEKVMALDPDKVERIILNLLSNAVKFTNNGGQIFVSIADKKDNVIISVKDNGVGIPENKLQMIFERFVQVDKTLRREHEGSGIGLSLVKSFVEMHQGRISINSELGVGSEFVIELPIKLLEQENVEKSYMYENNIERINIEFSDIYSDYPSEKAI